MHAGEIHADFAGKQADRARARALERHVHHVDFRHGLEELAGQMRGGAEARRAKREAARFCCGERNEFLDRPRRHRGVQGQDVSRRQSLRNRREIPLHVVGQRSSGSAPARVCWRLRRASSGAAALLSVRHSRRAADLPFLSSSQSVFQIGKYRLKRCPGGQSVKSPPWVT